VLMNSAEGAVVGVLGLAYKPFTGVVDCSPGLWLCQRLAERNRRVLAHDYLAGANAASALPAGRVRLCGDPRELARAGCQIFVITCPWPDYRKFFAPKKAESSRPDVVIVDPWNLLETVAPRLKNARYITNLSSPAASAPLPRLAARV
jgi:UDP-glucose 6-dehydrogenase